MTIGDLKTLIAGLPDDWPVKGYCAMEGVGGTEDNPRVVVGDDALWLDVQDDYSRKMGGDL